VIAAGETPDEMRVHAHTGLSPRVCRSLSEGESRPRVACSQMPEPEPDPELIAFAGRLFTMARGADPNRPNDRGQTPLAGAVFKDEPDVIRALVAGGADPAAGTPSALATAAMFEREDLAALLAADSGSMPEPG
jgi:hypothetical protein